MQFLKDKHIAQGVIIILKYFIHKKITNNVLKIDFELEMSNYIEAKQSKLTKEKVINKKAKSIVELINKFRSLLFEKKKITSKPNFF